MKIQIKSPCQEDWTKMSSTFTGKFCASCQKSVIDFTRMTDTEIQKIIHANNSDLCGRFRKTQVGRTLELVPSKQASNYLSYATSILLSLLASNAIAQPSAIPVQLELHTTSEKSAVFSSVKKISERFKPFRIAGKIHFASHVPEKVIFTLKGEKGLKRLAVPVIQSNNILLFSFELPQSLREGELEMTVHDNFNQVTIQLEEERLKYKSQELEIDFDHPNKISVDVIMGDVIGSFSGVPKHDPSAKSEAEVGLLGQNILEPKEHQKNPIPEIEEIRKEKGYREEDEETV